MSSNGKFFFQRFTMFAWLWLLRESGDDDDGGGRQQQQGQCPAGQKVCYECPLEETIDYKGFGPRFSSSFSCLIFQTFLAFYFVRHFCDNSHLLGTSEFVTRVQKLRRAWKECKQTFTICFALFEIFCLQLSWICCINFGTKIVTIYTLVRWNFHLKAL